MTENCCAQPEGYVVVVTCVVLRCFPHGKSKALILKRSMDEKEGPGLWAIPVGKVKKSDWGEPIQTASQMMWRGVLRRAIAREVREETGIAAQPEEFLLLPGEADCLFVRRDGMPTLVMSYRLHRFGKQAVRIKQTATEFRWATENEIERLSCIGAVAEDIKAAMFAWGEEALRKGS